MTCPKCKGIDVEPEDREATRFYCYTCKEFFSVREEE